MVGRLHHCRVTVRRDAPAPRGGHTRSDMA
jgi:hypothetical protein